MFSSWLPEGKIFVTFLSGAPLRVGMAVLSFRLRELLEAISCVFFKFPLDFPQGRGAGPGGGAGPGLLLPR